MSANVIDRHIEELRHTWGYETEELNDMRARLLDVMEAGFWEGKETEAELIKYKNGGNILNIRKNLEFIN